MNCGVCLQEPLDCTLKIFEVDDEQQNIAIILKQHLQFLEFSPNYDCTSPIICRCCWLKINEFHKFYVTIEQAHLEFVSSNERTLKDECKTDDPIYFDVEFDVDIKKELLENVNEEISQKKIEAEENLPEFLEVKLHAADTEIDTDERIGPKTRSKRGKKPYCASASETISKIRGKRQRRKSDYSDEDNDAMPSKQKIKKFQAISPIDDEMIQKHIPMGCDLCNFVGENFTAMSSHFRLYHKGIKPYVMCCKKKLSKRALLVQHAYKHEDPEHFKCKECQKVFADGYNLTSHIKAYHTPEIEMKYACNECPKRFARAYLLQLHQPSHIPINERKFPCSMCTEPNIFASEHLLRMHMQVCHTKPTNVCHVCAKGIRDKQAFEKHVRLHFEDSGPRVRCPRPGCDRWLKDEDNLKQHLRRHNDEGRIYKCSKCKKICKNQRALKGHMDYTHSKAEFPCTQCSKIFKKALSLKEHMAQHTGLSLYKCPFCDKTFNSNANMHSHKKKKHPVEWEIWRRTKRGSAQKSKNNDFVVDAAIKSYGNIVDTLISNGLSTDNESSRIS